MSDTRYPIHPEHFKLLDTEKIRDSFLLTPIFTDNKATHFYTHYDRLIVGGVKPVTRAVTLEAIDALKAEFFLQRRELGIINVGATGVISVDGTDHVLESKEALYIGKGT